MNDKWKKGIGLLLVCLILNFGLAYGGDGYPDHVVTTISIGDSPGDVAITPDGNYVYVANEEHNYVSVIRVSDNTVIDTISVGRGAEGVAVTPDGNYVYVTNHVDDTVSVIRTSDNKVIKTISIGDGTRWVVPMRVAVTPDGNYVYVVSSGANYHGVDQPGTVSVIRTSDNTVIKNISVENGAQGVAITPDGNYAYVANGVNNSTVSVIRTSDNTVIKNIYVGMWPVEVAVTPDGNYVYVTNWLANTVSVIRTSDNVAVKTISVGVRPGGVAVTPDGNYVYVTNGDSDNISVIRTSDNTVIDTITVGNCPASAVVTPDGKYVYVPNYYAGTVSVIGKTVAGFIDSGIDLIGIRRATIAWGDYDNDGDLDLALSGASEAEEAIARIYRNNGDGTFTDIQAGLSTWMIFRSPLVWGDYNNDGYLDLAICDWPNLRIYRNNGNDTFTNINNILIGTTQGFLAWGDYNNDGYLDLAVCGDTGSVAGIITRIYKNNGNGTFTDINAGLTGVEGYLAWGDYDNDGYLDLAVCGETETTPHWFITKIYRNNGNGTFTDIGAGLTEVGGGSLAWGDYDNDGYLDLAVCGRNYPYFAPLTTIYRNNGDNTFTNIGAELTGIAGSLAWGDYDNDGYLDLAVCGDIGSDSITQIYKNNGNGTFTDIGAGLPGVRVSAALAWSDYDNDGDLDLSACGESDSGYITKIYKNLEADAIGNNNPNTTPLAPTNLTYEEGSVILKWDSGYDDETPDNGLYYNLRVGTTTGNNDIVSGVYGSPLLGNYLRPKLSLNQLGVRLKNLPTGTYYWSVKTIDTGLQASQWSDEATFVSNHIPIADAGEDQTVYAGADGMANVTLDGSGSHDEDGDELTYLWLSSIDDADTIIATGVNPTIELPVGENIIKLVVNDGIVDSEPDEVVITVIASPTISGYVKTPSGTGISGVTMNFSNGEGSTTTDSSGYYSTWVSYGWSGTVTPTKTGYIFRPASRSYRNVTSNRSNQNYTGTQKTYTISGYIKTSRRVPIRGVVITFSNNGGSTKTNFIGYYSKTVPYGWSGRATPSRKGYVFSPSYRNYSNVTSSRTNQNYTGRGIR